MGRCSGGRRNTLRVRSEGTPARCKRGMRPSRPLPPSEPGDPLPRARARKRGIFCRSGTGARRAARRLPGPYPIQPRRLPRGRPLTGCPERGDRLRRTQVNPRSKYGDLLPRARAPARPGGSRLREFAPRGSRPSPFEAAVRRGGPGAIGASARQLPGGLPPRSGSVRAGSSGRWIAPRASGIVVPTCLVRPRRAGRRRGPRTGRRPCSGSARHTEAGRAFAATRLWTLPLRARDQSWGPHDARDISPPGPPWGSCRIFTRDAFPFDVRLTLRRLASGRDRASIGTPRRARARVRPPPTGEGAVSCPRAPPWRVDRFASDVGTR